MIRLSVALAATLALMAAALPARAELQLLMFEQAGCVYCAKWNAEIGPIYPKAPEGEAAPLRRIDLRGDWPAGVDLKSRPLFTPTFVLVRDGKELSRIEGYPGEDFFWGLLGTMLQDEPEWSEAKPGAADG